MTPDYQHAPMPKNAVSVAQSGHDVYAVTKRGTCWRLVMRVRLNSVGVHHTARWVRCDRPAWWPAREESPDA